MSQSPEIVDLPSLAQIMQKLRADGKRVVLCHGVFDLLHIGHIRYLRQAANLGDVLVVTITPDKYVDKGPHRPAFTSQLRAEALASLDCVNYVAINMWPAAEETLRLLKPSVYAKGSEFKNFEDPTGKIALEAAVCEEEGIEITFVEDIVFSSSTLINRYLSTFSKDCQEYLALFRQRHSLNSVLEYLDSFHDLTVMVVGDAIIDEYNYCSALGASSKDPVLALSHQSIDIFAGGSAAVANHVAQHVKKVIYCTIVGDDGQEEFIRNALSPNIEMHCIVRKGSPTVRKSRVVDSYSFQKLLEIYYMKRDALETAVDDAYISLVNQFISSVDIVMSADFGHGCISERHVAVLCASNCFLAVNTQANAGNRGYHTIDRYARADFTSLASHELTLQFRNRNMSTGEMLSELSDSLKSQYVLVTEGRHGCCIRDRNDLLRVPSFASNVVDRVGAGDALFSITTLSAFKKIPSDVIAFLGNIAGSLAVETMGNAMAVSRNAMTRYITSVMK